MTAVVVVGAGQAGFQVGASLRDKGYRGRIILVGAEPGIPYQRPPLSKAYLAGEVSGARLALRPPAFYETHDIELVDALAVGIDRGQHRLRLFDGRELDYAHLVLATGARNRELRVPGARLDGVLGLRTRVDADLIRERLREARDVVVIGGGFIGLEFAASVSADSLTVTVVEQADRVMQRAVSSHVSRHFESLHERHGNRILRNVAVTRIRGTKRVSAVELADGTILPADLVIVGIGVAPNTELAERAGLACDNGVVVDEHLSASDPDISAIGDCAAFLNSHAGRQIRLESVQNAVDHARCLASRLAGRPEPYAALPWFWSDQFDAKLQIAGLSTGHDRAILSGDPSTGSFSVLCFRAHRLIAVESVNRVRDHVAARRLLAAHRSPHPAEIVQVLGSESRTSMSTRLAMCDPRAPRTPVSVVHCSTCSLLPTLNSTTGEDDLRCDHLCDVSDARPARH